MGIAHPPCWVIATDHGQLGKHIVLLYQSLFANCQDLDLTTGDISRRRHLYPMI
jgi:hypothetical protein